MNTWGQEDELALDVYENFDVSDICQTFGFLTRRESFGRRPLGALNPNALPRRTSLRKTGQAIQEPRNLLAAELEKPDSAADRGGPGRSPLNGRHESLLCHESLAFDEPHPVSEDTTAPPVQAIEALSPQDGSEMPECILGLPHCTEETLQFLMSPTITASWFGSKGNCRGWEMLRFGEEVRIGRRKLLLLQSDTPVSLSVLIMREGVPLHDLGSSELHLERVNVERYVADFMSSGIPAEKNLANCSLALEVHLGPDAPEARILLHCERLGKARRRDAYTIIVLDNSRQGAVVCSWKCHVYNLKYESMNKKSKFVPTAAGAVPSRFHLKGKLWTPEEDCGLVGDLAR